MQLFYTDNVAEEFTLPPDESKHIIKVLRKEKGELVNFTDGKGNHLIAEIINSDLKKLRVRVINQIKKKKNHNYFLHIAISPTKNMNRLEWFLEKSTEIGIDEISILICDRSERKKINIDRCKRILLSSMKQSLKYHLPKINESISFNKFMKKEFSGNKYIAYCLEKRNQLKDEKIEKNNLILIGPEGDFSPKEIEISKKNNYKSVSLGNNRLRTETAGVIANSTINLIF